MRIGDWTGGISFHPDCWAIGGYFDLDECGLDLGPLGITFERDHPDFLHWSYRLFRLVIPRLKLDIRLALDLNIWRVGYLMAAPWDHGLYLGPLNLQVEYDVMYQEAF
jgi:hypothetical protein